MTPRSIASQASLSLGFSRQEYWSGLPFPSPGDLPDSGIEPASPASASRFFPTEPPRRSPLACQGCHNKIPQTGKPKQHEYISSQLWRLKVQDQSANRASVFQSFISWLANDHLSAVSSHGPFSDYTHAWGLFCFIYFLCFSLPIYDWRIIASQYCVGFCHIST